MYLLWASSSLPQSCQKNGDILKFPFPAVAALESVKAGVNKAVFGSPGARLGFDLELKSCLLSSIRMPETNETLA